MMNFAQLATAIVEVDSDIKWPSALVVMLAMAIQGIVFIACIFVLQLLWKVVVGALLGSKEPKAKLLLELLGGVTAEAEGSGGTTKGKVRVAGVGMLGTLLILAFGCIAIYLIGHHSALTSDKKTDDSTPPPANGLPATKPTASTVAPSETTPATSTPPER